MVLVRSCTRPHRPLAVDLDATTAKYENGVLFLTRPKKSDASLHRVTIN
jgi:HSP20 family molecular chaperone IbpA